MRGLFGRTRKAAYTDSLASRFAFWIINRKGPPDDADLKALERERKRHLQRMAFEIGFYFSLGVVMAVLAPEWVVIIVALVLVLSVPKIVKLGRDMIATPALFRPAEEVAGLLDEVEKARETSEAVAVYCKQVKKARRPLMRVEALALVTVPQLNEQDWLEEPPPSP
ncbi:MAG: hypothetical protein JJU06_21300 [Ectothiorhodospiraceae bacterium]|nr:hypothetical protein [Ectothiorhodospiraceae bacterium]MCH8506944.1 hypothetical protein [Ectothiorhodospiraceae bacterium]